MHIRTNYLWPLLLFFFALSFTFFAIQSGDVLMYLSLARDYVLAGRWEQTDIYLYSKTNGELVWWHEYLSYLFFYGLWWLGGTPALILSKMALLSAMFAFTLLARPTTRNAQPVWIAIWILAILAGSFRYIERSSLISDLFTLVVAWRLLYAKQISRRLIVELSFLFVLWIQLHPGFVSGLIFLAAWAAWRFWIDKGFRTQKVFWLAVPVAVLLLNPLFLEGFLYPFKFSINEAQTLRRFNFEWFPSYHPAFRFAPEVIAFWTLSLASFFFFLRHRAWKSLNAIFALIAFLITLNAVRFMPWSTLVIAMAVKPYALTFKVNLDRRLVHIAMALLLLLVGVRNFSAGYMSSAGLRIPALKFDPKFFPSKTLEILKTNRIAGRLYNSHDFGSSLIWNQMTPIFHHGFVTDMDFYRNEVIGVMQSPQVFQALVAKYGWTMLLIDKYGGYREFYRILSPMTDWKIVAEDESAYLIYFLPDSKDQK